MLKVFLVEDECVVREGLRECIDWARYGFEFCGDAPDGELALHFVPKHCNMEMVMNAYTILDVSGELSFAAVEALRGLEPIVKVRVIQ